MLQTIYSRMVENLLALLIVLLSMGGCGTSSEEPEPETVTATASFRTSGSHTATVAGYASDQLVDLRAPLGTTYTLTIVEGGDWCWTSRLNQTTTTQGRMAAASQSAKIYLSDNLTTQPRVAQLEVLFDTGVSVRLTLTQHSYEKPAIYDRMWAELPEYKESASTMTVTHYAPLNASTVVRNYTICFDTEKGYSLWAAYPLHKCYMQGTYSRSNDWQYDPKIPIEYQPDLSHGSYAGSGSGWIRGHQVMSNHRYVSYSDELNAQTFYSTNIMPQNSAFNSGLWNDVEFACTNKGATTGCDTLYCVTGAYGVQGWTSDKAGKKVAIPEYCYKVMLKARSAKENTPIWQITDPSKLMAIGYCAYNSSASNSGKPSDYTMSVAELEELTGLKFFPMLHESVATEVKAQHKPSDWNIN